MLTWKKYLSVNLLNFQCIMDKTYDALGLVKILNL